MQGRTGLVICCYLLFSGLCETATLALNKYGEARTYNNKGVTIASQIRYVYYFSQLLRSVPAPVEYTYKIRHIRLITVPNFDVVGAERDPLPSAAAFLSAACTFTCLCRAAPRVWRVQLHCTVAMRLYATVGMWRSCCGCWRCACAPPPSSKGVCA